MLLKTIKSFLIVIVVAFLGIVLYNLFLVGILFNAVAKHDSNEYQWDNFKCKNQYFYNIQPVYLYRYNFDGNSASANNEYQLEPDKDNLQTLLQNHDAIQLKTYPIGTRFQFISIFTHVGFSSGGISDFLIEDEWGVRSLINTHDIDTENCTFDIFMQFKEYWPTEGNKTRITQTEKDKNFQKTPQNYSVIDDLSYLQKQTELLDPNGSKVLHLKVPNKTLYHYSKQIVDTYISDFKKEGYKLHIEENTTDIFVPTFYTNNHYFSQFTCNNMHPEDIFYCYKKDFLNWLHTPYKTTNYVPIERRSAVEKKFKKMQKKDILLVAYLNQYAHQEDLNIYEYTKVIYAYNKLLKLNRVSTFIENNLTTDNINNFIFFTEGDKNSYHIKSGINIFGYDKKPIRNIYFLDYRLDAHLYDFPLWKKYSDPFFDYHHMTKNILIFKKKNYLTLFTTKQGLSEVQSIIQAIKPLHDQYTTTHILEHSPESFKEQLDIFHIDHDLNFKNRIVISAHNYNKDLIAFKDINLSEHPKKILDNITSFLMNHIQVMEEK